MIGMEELFKIKADCEKNKLFAEAQISVIDKMIEMEQAKETVVEEQSTEVADESYQGVILNERN